MSAILHRQSIKKEENNADCTLSEVSSGGSLSWARALEMRQWAHFQTHCGFIRKEGDKA